MTGALRLDAPAKLNLELRVVGRRDDGLHLLDGHFVLLDLADRLLLMPGCSGLRVDGDRDPSIPLDATNLAWRGLVEGLDGEPELACLALEKRIPVQAGLGGGSSDAAAAWRLGRAWRGAPPAADAVDLERLSRIGADVPFFAAQVGAARVGGIGERIEALAASEAHVVLAHSRIGLSTAAVFAELRPDEWGTASNDLLAPALRLRPELVGLMDAVAHCRWGAAAHRIGTDRLYHHRRRRARRLDRRTPGEGHGVGVTLTRTRTGPARIETITDDEEDSP